MPSSFGTTITSISAPSTITYVQFLEKCQKALAGTDYKTDEWSPDTIQEWIKDAIRDYSLRFHRKLSASITTAVNDRQYDLPIGLVEILSVEYPTAQDPPMYLSRKYHQDYDFWQEVGHYDVLSNTDANNPNELLISEKPSTGQTITVIYEGVYDPPVGDTDPITVPERHHDVLLMYIVWKGWLGRRERAVSDLAAGKIDNQTFERIGKNAYNARLDYFTTLNQADKNRADTSRIIKWEMPDYLERIY